MVRRFDSLILQIKKRFSQMEIFCEICRIDSQIFDIQ